MIEEIEEILNYLKAKVRYSDDTELMQERATVFTYYDLKKMLDYIIYLQNITNDIDKYIHSWKIGEIGEKTMLILNDILLIKNGKADVVSRLMEITNNDSNV